jgi:hypothetical protein
VPVHKLSEKLIFIVKSCLSAHSGRVFLLLAARAFTSSCHRASTKRCVRALYLCLQRDFLCRITEYCKNIAHWCLVARLNWSRSAACCYSPGLALALLRGWTIRAHALCTARIAVLSQLQKHARRLLVFMYGVSCLFEPRFDCQRLLVLLQSGPLCTATLWCRSGCGRAAPAPACCSCDSRDLRPS